MKSSTSLDNKLAIKTAIKCHLRTLEALLLDALSTNRHSSSSAEVCYRLAVFYLNSSAGCKEERNAKAKEYLLAGGNRMHCLCIYLLGWLAEMARELPQAEELYMAALRLSPQDPLTHPKLLQLVSSTSKYVQGLSELESSVLPRKGRKKGSGASNKESPAHLKSRVLLHSRIECFAGQIKPQADARIVVKQSGKVTIDPLFASEFVYRYDRCESWCWSAVGSQ